MKGLPWVFTAACLKVAFAWCRASPGHPKADFALTRVLRQERLADDEWLEAAGLALAWLRRVPHARKRNFLLNSLFTRPELLTPEARGWLVDEARTWLGFFDPKFWAGALRGTAVKLEVGAALRTEARATVAPERLREYVTATDRLFSHQQLVGVGLSLAVLYPATARPELVELHREVLEPIHRFLDHPKLDPRWRDGFLASCKELLDSGAWPCRELGEKALAAIGFLAARAEA